ncbi:MAG: hypothetical protein BWX84_00047 [Verrucomicrobia bacterium ADurb.Bin118]|nr:MAG: hypothetical protein BWX84_00047 [Verrucomicrobia bacterium ADurb.Bin118]
MNTTSNMKQGGTTVIEIKNLLFEPLRFYLKGGGLALHLNPRERRTLGEDDIDRISPEIDAAAKRGLVSLTPATPTVPEPETAREEPVETETENTTS